MSRQWSSADELIATIHKRWERGRYLRDYASGVPWEPITLPVKAPAATELLNDFEKAAQWADRFRRDIKTGRCAGSIGVEHRNVRSLGLGANVVPARIRIETFEQLCSLLGTAGEVRLLDEIMELTADALPDLLPWVIEHPAEAVAHHQIWERILGIIRWITNHDTGQFYLRHIDVPGVDTKFVERHRKLLDKLLTIALPLERVDRDQTGFARRFGFRGKPHYTRFRLLAPLPTVPAGLSELRLRTDELAKLDLPVDTVFVVENEISYLAFPDVPEAVVIFGEGFALTVLEALPWLHAKDLVYWGDTDTHGFAMLDRLRSRFTSVRSILMDHEAFLAHPDQHVTEPNPTHEPLAHLTEAEQSLYQDLVEDRFGPALRLEQERVRFSLLTRALEHWTKGL